MIFQNRYTARRSPNRRMIPREQEVLQDVLSTVDSPISEAATAHMSLNLT